MEKKEEARRKKKRSQKIIRKKLELEEEPDEVRKRLWDSYLKVE